MKKAFTMIELVFVIAIIGVLSAIVAPKLMGTRTDAEIAKLKEQVRAINTSIQAYSKQKMIITGNMDEDENYPKELNDKGVLFGKVLGGADVSRWAQDTNEKVVEDFLYTYTIKGYGKFSFVYVAPGCGGEEANCVAAGIAKITTNAVKHATYWYFPSGHPERNAESSSQFPIGSFKCYLFKDKSGKIDNSICDKLFS